MKMCNILGFKNYEDKETKVKMIRIVITIKSTDDKYVGKMPVPVYFEYEENLEQNLIKAIQTNASVRYETEENILTGKTKVKNLIFN